MKHCIDSLCRPIHIFTPFVLQKQTVADTSKVGEAYHSAVYVFFSLLIVLEESVISDYFSFEGIYGFSFLMFVGAIGMGWWNIISFFACFKSDCIGRASIRVMRNTHTHTQSHHLSN